MAVLAEVWPEEKATPGNSDPSSARVPTSRGGFGPKGRKPTTNFNASGTFDRLKQLVRSRKDNDDLQSHVSSTARDSPGSTIASNDSCGGGGDALSRLRKMIEKGRSEKTGVSEATTEGLLPSSPLESSRTDETTPFEPVEAGAQTLSSAPFEVGHGPALGPGPRQDLVEGSGSAVATRTEPITGVVNHSRQEVHSACGPPQPVLMPADEANAVSGDYAVNLNGKGWKKLQALYQQAHQPGPVATPHVAQQPTPALRPPCDENREFGLAASRHASPALPSDWQEQLPQFGGGAPPTARDLLSPGGSADQLGFRPTRSAPALMPAEAMPLSTSGSLPALWSASPPLLPSPPPTTSLLLSGGGGDKRPQQCASLSGVSRTGPNKRVASVETEGPPRGPLESTASTTTMEALQPIGRPPDVLQAEGFDSDFVPKPRHKFEPRPIAGPGPTLPPVFAVLQGLWRDILTELVWQVSGRGVRCHGGRRGHLELILGDVRLTLEGSRRYVKLKALWPDRAEWDGGQVWERYNADDRPPFSVQPGSHRNSRRELPPQSAEVPPVFRFVQKMNNAPPANRRARSLPTLPGAGFIKQPPGLRMPRLPIMDFSSQAKVVPPALMRSEASTPTLKTIPLFQPKVPDLEDTAQSLAGIHAPDFSGVRVPRVVDGPAQADALALPSPVALPEQCSPKPPPRNDHVPLQTSWQVSPPEAHHGDVPMPLEQCSPKPPPLNGHVPLQASWQVSPPEAPHGDVPMPLEHSSPKPPPRNGHAPLQTSLHFTPPEAYHGDVPM
eukprot:CAMPEP_0117476738 /NCGR_PEP_ID=MMETSP0784-20121206/10463_1 /TAXON_ID=39447 /ORGANISM="" /LENGTH=782 /DNA_ID=CAMNT_0005271021 /DNA_START=16 /DNA_END=2361 /DNA_ORIENTATION=-